MEKILVKGDVYTVATKTECKVTSANGTPLGTATAEAPYTFPATTDRVVLSDSDAEFARVNPKYAPVKLRLLGLLGGGESASSLPAGYIAAEWLGTDTGEAYITVPLNKKGDQTLKIETEHYTTEATQAMIEGSKDKAYVGSYTGITPGYLFVYFTWVASGLVVRGDWNTHVVEVKHEPCRQIIYHPTGERVVEAANRNDYAVPTYTLFRVVGTDAAPWVGKKRTWKAWLDGKLAFDLIPVISPDGRTCMYNKVTKEAYSNIGAEPFVVGMTLSQSLKLADLPDVGGELTVSLPWEAQLVSSGVPDALQIATDKGWTITVQYREAEKEQYNTKYAACTNVAAMQAVDADYRNDLTPAGEWAYALPALTDGTGLHNGNKEIKGFVADMPKLTQSWNCFHSCSNLEYFIGSCPKLTQASQFFNMCYALRVVRADFSAVTDGNHLCCDCAALRVFDAMLPNLNRGELAFHATQLDKQSTLNVLLSIPAYDTEHPMRIGIHVDNKNDADVAEAIAEAEGKGWVLTVQWRGTATAASASTYGLRREPIYAKLEDIEMPDGTQKTILDWGHYATNWEARGYQEFASVEEAMEYFNVEN